MMFYTINIYQAYKNLLKSFNATLCIRIGKVVEAIGFREVLNPNL
jgi:hypothetical protein